MTNGWRERLGVLAVCGGMAAAVPSVRHTAGHVTDPSYRTPETRHGPGHVQYHMAREVALTAGAFGVLVSGVAAGRDRSRAGWRAMACAAGGYAAAMWSGGPVVGSWAPNRAALTIHAVSTAAMAAGVLALRPRRSA